MRNPGQARTVGIRVQLVEVGLSAHSEVELPPRPPGGFFLLGHGERRDEHCHNCEGVLPEGLQDRDLPRVDSVIGAPNKAQKGLRNEIRTNYSSNASILRVHGHLYCL